MADQDLKVWAETLTPDPLKGNNQRRDIEDEEWDEGWGRLSGVTAQQLNQLFYLVTGNLITAKEDILTNTDNISNNTSNIVINTGNISKNTLDIAEIKEDIHRVDVLTVEMCLTEIVPTTHTELDGKSFDTVMFPRLGEIFPSGILPDTRGMMLKHSPDGRSVLSFEAESIKNHSHTATQATHTHSATFNGNPLAPHGHSLAQPNGKAVADSNLPSSGGSLWSNYSENYNPQTVVSASAGTPSGSVSLGNATPTITVNPTGGSKNLVDNIAVKFIIKKV